MENIAPPRTNGVGEGEDTPKPDEDLQAAIYARTSSNSQRFGYSIDEQVRRCWEFCENASWNIVFVFSDEAESGRDTERPEFQSMLEQARNGFFDVVIFWKLDRFCRSLVDLVKTEEELGELGVGLHSVTEFLDTTNPVGRFNFRNLASAAELESDLISQRVRMGMYGLARERKWPNDHPPLGYKKRGDGTLRIDEREGKLVRLVFDLYIEEHSMPQVAFLLNQSSETTNHGDSWCRQSVGKVLRNELYIGHYQIADFEANVEEYRILPDSVFEEAKNARFRFKHAQTEMDNSRKQTKAEKIIDEYRAYQDSNST